ncbi:MAG: NTP transferase domain-containing protein, partial [Clostridium sp.]|nr:NTP transferase domain-containing protein [Clostridium sp.]
MDISALVLAGGKSSRMNGNNKAFLSYNNKSFLENIIDALEDITQPGSPIIGVPSSKYPS